MSSFKGKTWIILSFLLGCAAAFIYHNLDYKVHHTEESEILISYSIFERNITDETHNKLSKFEDIYVVLFAISSLIFALSVLNMLKLKYGRKVLKAASNISSKINDINEDKAMDKMLKLKQLYDAELISKDEYETKLAKLKSSIA